MLSIVSDETEWRTWVILNACTNNRQNSKIKRIEIGWLLFSLKQVLVATVAENILQFDNHLNSLKLNIWRFKLSKCTIVSLRDNYNAAKLLDWVNSRAIKSTLSNDHVNFMKDKRRRIELLRGISIPFFAEIGEFIKFSTANISLMQIS